MVYLLILLFSFNVCAESGINISSLLGAEVVVDPYNGIDYDEIVVYEFDRYDYGSSDAVQSLGDGYKEDEKEREVFETRIIYTPVLYNPFTFSDFSD